MIESVYYDASTTNKSFIRMSAYLKDRGVQNNKMCLQLFNNDLSLVNAHEVWRVNKSMQESIIEECKKNIWYFLREVARVKCHETGLPVQVDLNHATMAKVFCSRKGIDTYVTTPTYTFKTTHSRLILMYDMMFSEGATYAVQSNEDIIEIFNLFKLLPEYMQHLSHNMLKHCVLIDTDRDESIEPVYSGCVVDNIEHMETPIFTYYPTRRKHNSSISINSEKDRPVSVYDIYDTSIGKHIELLESTVMWDNLFFDMNHTQLSELKPDNESRLIFYVEANYKQMGLSLDWRTRKEDSYMSPTITVEEHTKLINTNLKLIRTKGKYSLPASANLGKYILPTYIDTTSIETNEVTLAKETKALAEATLSKIDKISAYIESVGTKVEDSFQRFSDELKYKGIKNHDFLTKVINPELKDLNPHDYNHTKVTKLKIYNECMINPWYFFRHFAKIQVDETRTKNLEANMKTLSTLYLALKGFNVLQNEDNIDEMRDVNIALYSWIFLFNPSDIKINIISRNITLSDLTNTIEPFLRYVGETYEVDSTKSSIRNSESHLRILLNSTCNEYVGRGLTYSPYIDAPESIDKFNTLFMSSLPSLAEARRNAKLNDSIFTGTILTTNLNVDMTIEVVNFNIKLFDESIENHLIRKSDRLNIEYTALNTFFKI